MTLFYYFCFNESYSVRLFFIYDEAKEKCEVNMQFLTIGSCKCTCNRAAANSRSFVKQLKVFFFLGCPDMVQYNFPLILLFCSVGKMS